MGEQGDGAHPWGCSSLSCCCGWPRWLFASTSLLSPPRCSVERRLSPCACLKKADMHGSKHQQMAAPLAPGGPSIPGHVSAAVLLRDPLGTPPSCPRPQHGLWPSDHLPVLLRLCSLIDRRDNYRSAGSLLCLSPGIGLPMSPVPPARGSRRSQALQQ